VKWFEKKLTETNKLNMNVTNLLICPNEIIEMIFADLPARDLSALSKTCRRLHDLVCAFSTRWRKKFGDKFFRIVRLFEEEPNDFKDEYIPWREHYHRSKELKALFLQRQLTANDGSNSSA